MTQIARLILYPASAILFAILAYNLIPVSHILARWFGILLVANAINALTLFVMLFYLKASGTTSPVLSSMAWTTNAVVMFAVAVGLLFAFYKATRNGNGP